MVKCDLLVDGEAERILAEFRPDAVIHSAAERRPDVVSKRPDAAQKLNVDVTRDLAAACAKYGSWMIFLSTDYIFDGEDPPYSVHDMPHPLSKYGEQKVEGERLTLAICPLACVLRVPLLFGPMEYVKESGVTALHGLLEKDGIKQADHSQKRYPTYTPDVAKVLRKMLEVNFESRRLTGIYHWQANECLTKYDMMLAIAKVMKFNRSEIKPNTDPPKFPRPEDSRLDSSRLEKELGIDDGEGYRSIFYEALKHSYASYLAANIQPRMATELREKYSLEEVMKFFDDFGGTVDHETLKGLMNKEGHISSEDYAMLIGHHLHE